MTSEICGITPEQRTLRRNTSPYAPSETTPSWMRAPPESLIPMTGQPILPARSMILHIFSAMTSPSEPPNTVKSCEKTHTRRPSIVPWPVTTASPHGRFLSISKSAVRWRTYVSSSWKEPGSSSFSIRSRAVYLPLACCFSTAFSEAWWMAASRSSASWASRSSCVSGAFWRIGRLTLSPEGEPPRLPGGVPDEHAIGPPAAQAQRLPGADPPAAERGAPDGRAVAPGGDPDAAAAAECEDRRAAGHPQRRAQLRDGAAVGGQRGQHGLARPVAGVAPQLQRRGAREGEREALQRHVRDAG